MIHEPCGCLFHREVGVEVGCIACLEAALDHDGFSFIQCLSECVEFFPGAFDSANPRKGGQFLEVPKTHDVQDEVGAYKLASEPFPGYFGIFYKAARPTKNAIERKIQQDAQAKVGALQPWQILQKTFDRLR